MTADEIKRRLEEAGIPVGGWAETKGGERPLPEMLKRQRAVLEAVRALVQAQVEQDKAKVAELHETLERLKHGGGR